MYLPLEQPLVGAGLLAGSEGIVGIEFDDPVLAQSLGIVAPSVLLQGPTIPWVPRLPADEVVLAEVERRLRGP